MYDGNKALTAIVLTITLTACGGGGGGGSSAPTAAAPTPPPTASDSDQTTESIVKVGPITGFGSVFVDGERFETGEDTDIRRDDDLSDEDDLSIGMIVRVQGSSKNSAGDWIADEIEFDEDVEGPVDRVESGALVVLGQRVLITDATRIDDGLALQDFAPGDIVEVSGNRTADDSIDALFVEKKLPGEIDEYEVIGQIRELDEASETFRIGGLLVRYGTVPARLDDIGSGLTNGMLVEVEDETRSYQPEDLELNATKVEGENPFESFADSDDSSDSDSDSEDDSSDSSSGSVELEAVITEIIDDSSFALGPFLVSHGPQTRFSGGSASDLAENVRVEVEGTLSGNLLSALEIEFEDDEARIDGLVTDVNEAQNQLAVMGVIVNTSGARFSDDLRDESPFGLEDLMVGDFVEIEGRETDNQVNAVEIERDDPDDDSKLRGTLDAADEVAGTVTLFGKVITTNESTEYRIEDSPISAEQFFQRLHAGQTIVEAKWNGPVSDTLLPADELSIEN